MTFNYCGDDRTITLYEIDAGLQQGVRLPRSLCHHKSPRNQCSVGFLQIESTGTADGIQRLSLYMLAPAGSALLLFKQPQGANLFYSDICARFHCLYRRLTSTLPGYFPRHNEPPGPASNVLRGCLRANCRHGREYAWMEKAPAALMPLMKACKRPAFSAPGEAGCL